MFYTTGKQWAVFNGATLIPRANEELTLDQLAPIRAQLWYFACVSNHSDLTPRKVLGNEYINIYFVHFIPIVRFRHSTNSK